MLFITRIDGSGIRTATMSMSPRRKLQIALAILVVVVSIVTVTRTIAHRSCDHDWPSELIPPLINGHRPLAVGDLHQIHVAYIALDDRGNEYVVFAMQLNSNKSELSFKPINTAKSDEVGLNGTIHSALPDLDQWQPHVSEETRHYLSEFNTALNGRFRDHRQPQGFVGGIFREWVAVSKSGLIVYIALGDGGIWFLDDELVTWMKKHGHHMNSHAPADHGNFRIYELCWSAL